MAYVYLTAYDAEHQMLQTLCKENVQSTENEMVPPKVFTCTFRSCIRFYKLLCASKFTTAKIECLFEMGK